MLGRLTGYILGYVRRSPRRRALLRQRRADYAVIHASPAFDPAWYRATAMDGDPATDPVAHYLWKGAPAGREPHALFDTAWYSARNPDIGLETPFAHYLRTGMQADQDPHPLFQARFYLAQSPEATGRALLHYGALPAGDTRSPARLFDPVAYPAGLAHWIGTGAAGEQDPHALFSTAWYRRTHLSATPGRNPLAHWVREGAALGLATNPYGIDPMLPLRLPAPGDNPAATILLQRGRSRMETVRSLHAIAQNSGVGQGTPAEFEVILIDPEPAPVLVRHLRAAPSRRAAAAGARGRVLVLLGAGAVVHPGWLAALLDTAATNAAVGVVSCQTLRTDGVARSAGISVMPDGDVRFEQAGGDPAQPCPRVSHAVRAPDPDAMLVRREAWDLAGGLDDTHDSPGAAAVALAFALHGSGLCTVLQPGSLVSLPHGPVPASDRDMTRLRKLQSPAHVAARRTEPKAAPGRAMARATA